MRSSDDWDTVVTDGQRAVTWGILVLALVGILLYGLATTPPADPSFEHPAPTTDVRHP